MGGLPLLGGGTTTLIAWGIRAVELLAQVNRHRQVNAVDQGNPPPNYPLKWTLLTVNVKVDSCFCTQPRTNTLIGFVFPITCNLTG
eukprot:m.405522 g.405522  ORF g.405522 m.405522 type:complete len:86 (+) comp16795_c1_seq11:453-710(+)